MIMPFPVEKFVRELPEVFVRVRFKHMFWATKSCCVKRCNDDPVQDAIASKAIVRRATPLASYLLSPTSPVEEYTFTRSDHAFTHPFYKNPPIFSKESIKREQIRREHELVRRSYPFWRTEISHPSQLPDLLPSQHYAISILDCGGSVHLRH